MITHQSHGCKRRRQDKAAIKARLVLREDTKGNVGLISQDLFTELFPATRKGEQMWTDFETIYGLIHVWKM